MMLIYLYIMFGLGDVGVYCGVLCDVSFLFMWLIYWGWDRMCGFKLLFEWIIRKMIKDSVDLLGLCDWGMFELGMWVDVNVIDFDNFVFYVLEMVFDLFVGGK